MAKKTKKIWFVRKHWSYLPCSWQGWILYVPYIAWLVVAFLFVNEAQDSIGAKLIGIVPYWLSGAIVLQWIASHTSGKN